jgi:S-adenosyl-L-methionine hydrolase (adenosine-forming)
MSLVTLTTDFGTNGPYVAALKGVLLDGAPDTQIVDITHSIRPQNVREAALVLAQACPWFPTETLHIVVVDPGVGTERHIVYAEIGGQCYLTPDNGVLSALVRDQAPSKLIVVENRQFWNQRISHTFHGRDIFAPVAAALLNGIKPEQLGPATAHLKRFPWPKPYYKQSTVLRGEVLYIDPFGNLLTTIEPRHLPIDTPVERLRWSCAGQTCHGLHMTYGNATPGELIALTSSAGWCELAIVNGNAAKSLNVAIGEPVEVCWHDE